MQRQIGMGQQGPRRRCCSIAVATPTLAETLTRVAGQLEGRLRVWIT
ncbi:hypothetical protein ACRAWF_12015 [Streptomyces sp. L7]